jgi:tryptophanyl-tRNA synthetase
MERIDPWGGMLIRDYKKLIEEFGISDFKPLLGEIENPSLLMRRGVIFGHRDFDKFISSLRKGEKVAVVSGIMPSGSLHLGHKMVLDQLVYYQRLGAHIFLPIADAEAYSVRGLERNEVINYGVEIVAHAIALGLQKDKLTIYFQTNYKKEYYRLIQIFSKKVTMNEMQAIYGDLEPSKIISSLTQAADILHPQLKEFGEFKQVLVPVGADQDPHIRLTRDLAQRTKRELGFNEPASTYHRLMSGLDGGKMSKSRPDSVIYLLEDEDSIKQKIKKALTGGRASIEEQKVKGGEPWRCMIYELYLYHLVQEDDVLISIFNDCVKGKLLCGPDKEYAIERLTKWVEQYKHKYEKAKDRVQEYVDLPTF